MMLLAAILAVFAVAAAGLALFTLVAGPKAARRLTRKALPDAVRQGSTGGLLTSLEGVEGRGVRAALLVLASAAFGFGSWLAMQAV